MGSRKHRERVRESKFIGPLFTQEYLARLICLAGMFDWQLNAILASVCLLSCSVAPFFLSFFGDCPTKNGLPQKGFPVLPGSVWDFSDGFTLQMLACVAHAPCLFSISSRGLVKNASKFCVAMSFFSGDIGQAASPMIKVPLLTAHAMCARGAACLSLH